MGLLGFVLGLNPGPAITGVQAFKSSLGGLQSAAQSVAGKVTAALGLVGISFAAFKTAGGFSESLKGVFDAGKELKTNRAITGQSITDMLVLRKAYKDTGLGAEEVMPSLAMMQKALGGVNEEGQPTVGMFARLHLNIAKLKGENAITQIEAIGGAINKLGTQSEKVAASDSIFGRNQGTRMLALFSELPARINEAKSSMGGYAAIMERDAVLFTEITNALESLSGKVRGFFVGFADQIGPVLLPLLNKLKDFNLIEAGERIGAFTRTLTAAFTSGEIGDLAWLSLQVAAVKFANALAGGVTSFASAYGAYWAVVVNEWHALFEHLPSVWQGIKSGMIGAIQAAGAVLLEVFQAPIVALQAGLEYALQSIVEKIPKPIQKAIGFDAGINHESFDEITERRKKEGGSLFGKSAEDLAGKSTDNLAAAKASFGEYNKDNHIQAALNDVKRAAKEGWEKGGQLIDVTPMEDELKEKWKKLGAVKPSIPPAAPIKKGAAAAMVAIDPVKPFSDRLSKIGGFIGGSGGVRAEKYAADTARNTFFIVEYLRSATALNHTRRPQGSTF